MPATATTPKARFRRRSPESETAAPAPPTQAVPTKQEVRGKRKPRGGYTKRSGGYEFTPQDMGLARAFRPPLRSSLKADWDRCPRYFYYKNRLGLHSRGYQSALRIGEAYHLLHETLAKTGSVTSAYKAHADLQQKILTEQQSQANELGILPGGKPLDGVVTLIVKDMAVARAMFDFASLRDPPQGRMPGTHDKPKFEVVAAEQTFRVPGGSIDARVRADLIIKVDVLLRRLDTGQFYIRDYKTTSESPIQMAVSLPWSFQSRLYRLVMERVLQPHQKLRGVIHAIIRKPGIRLKQQQTLDEYIAEVAQWYTTNQAKDTSDPPYLTSTIVLASDPYPLELQQELRQLSTACHAYAWPSRYPRCGGTGGAEPCIKWKTLCPYLPLCSNNQQKWPSLIQRLYDIEDPSRLQPGETPPVILESPTGQPTGAIR